MKTIIKCTDGSVAIMTLVEGADLDTVISKWQQVHPNMYLSHREMPDDVIPTDRTFYEAWEADFTNPTGHGIGAHAWFAEQAAKEQA